MDTKFLDDIYDFWFGNDRSPMLVNRERIEWWMMQNDDTDRAVRERFGHLIEPASRVAWDVCNLTREQGVALVVLFDQCPRNIYRTSGEAYAYDHIARDLAERLTADGWERFTAMEKFILGLPYIHHENEAAQDYGVMLMSEICVRAPEPMREGLRFDLDQATRHRDVIRRFGRFPHRNKALGRESTEEEIAFLATALRGRGF